MGPIVLGINGDAWGHDHAACLVADGKVLVAIEEERLTRNKSTHTFPYTSVEYVLDYCNLTASDLDIIAFSWTFSPLTARSWYPAWKEWRQPGARRRDVLHATVELPLLQTFRRLELACSHGYVARDRAEHLRLVQVPHHLAHMAAAYAESGLDECAVCVLDGTGEIETATGYRCRDGRWSRVLQVKYPDSLGLVYGGITQHLGYRICRDEYKVMALAAFGREDAALAAFFRSLIQLGAGGGFRVNRRLFALRRWSDQVWSSYLTPEGRQTLGPVRHRDEPIAQRHCDIAYALQRRTEEAVVSVLRELHARTGCNHLVLTGGVALNSVCNGKILPRTGFQSVFVPASPTDAGTAIGAALLAVDASRTPQVEISPYLGPEFTHDQMKRAAQRAGLRVEHVGRTDLAVAARILEGAIVGWFQGRMEFGPRALGNRSILADPSRAGVRERLNAIKGREEYRPFGISVPEHRAGDVCRTLRRSSRMMMVDALADRSAYAAVRHVDGTTRLHTVTPEENPTFYSLLAAVEQKSGVPGVLNTSFNVDGEPIVCSPADALRTFAVSSLDVLCMGDLIASKSGTAHADAVAVRDTTSGGLVATRPSTG